MKTFERYLVWRAADGEVRFQRFVDQKPDSVERAALGNDAETHRYLLVQYPIALCGHVSENPLPGPGLPDSALTCEKCREISLARYGW